VWEISLALQARYKDFSHYNKKNPLDELLYIICSLKTDEGKYQSTFRALKQTFPRFSDLALASHQEIASAIVGGGLYNQKATTIRGLVDAIIKRFGKFTLNPLYKMSNEECEIFLVSLPGVGKKTARCVMMYSLNREVFPVDTHCWRIANRLGWVTWKKKDVCCRQPDMDILQNKIPPELRFSLHVNMVSLGREICTPHIPRCSDCPINKYCPRIGVSQSR
jgi:endonuclease III